MLDSQYEEQVTILGRTVTLAQLDIALRCATLAVCLVSLVVSLARLRRNK